MSKLNNEIAVYQTARNAYIVALKAELEPTEDSAEKKASVKKKT